MQYLGRETRKETREEWIVVAAAAAATVDASEESSVSEGKPDDELG